MWPKDFFFKHYRQFTRFKLEECLLRLRDMFPELTRSSLHRCFKRHGVGRLPWGKLTTIEKEATSAPGCFFLTIYGGGEGTKLFAAIEVGSGRVYCRRLPRTPNGAVIFLQNLFEHYPEGDEKRVVTYSQDNAIFLHAEKEGHLGYEPFFAARQNLDVHHEVSQNKKYESGLGGSIRIGRSPL
jgi:hypothetical protein